jgi:hypothetical protein
MNIRNDMTTQELIDLATKYAQNGAAMQSSAELCLKEAKELYAMAVSEPNTKSPFIKARKVEFMVSARGRAIDSLKYSIGILHAEFPR